MAGRPTVFDEDSAKLIEKVVKGHKPPTLDMVSNGHGRLSRSRFMFVRIVEWTYEQFLVKHGWVEYERTATGWQDKPDGMTGTTATNPILSLDGMPLPSNLPILAHFDWLPGTDTFVGTAINSKVMIPVSVWKVGGSAGDKDNYCSFTYDVFEIAAVGGDGYKIAVNVPLTGNGNRIVKATMTPGTKGMGYFESGTSFYLMWVDEQFSQTNCP